ncbi:hypothetical protein [Scytonema sp. PCC 10023]|uniref:hypothetical protein n=1 Tax=Scytonema sp. PCC 10023 TaxID=1680591 RepID=UPI0039C6B662
MKLYYRGLRRPFLQVIVDLTTLEKRGKFKEFKDFISVYNQGYFILNVGALW